MAVLASALGCGLLMGIERERRKGDGPFRSLAGVRSFALASLSGDLASLPAQLAAVADSGTCPQGSEMVGISRNGTEGRTRPRPDLFR